MLMVTGDDVFRARFSCQNSTFAASSPSKCRSCYYICGSILWRGVSRVTCCGSDFTRKRNLGREKHNTIITKPVIIRGDFFPLPTQFDPQKHSRNRVNPRPCWSNKTWRQGRIRSKLRSRMVNTVVVTAAAVTYQRPPHCQWDRLCLRLRHAGVCLHPHPSVGCVDRPSIWAITKRCNSRKVCGTVVVDRYPIQQRLHVRPRPRQLEQFVLLMLELPLAPCWKWQCMMLCHQRCGQDRVVKNWRVTAPAPAFPANINKQAVRLRRRR